MNPRTRALITIGLAITILTLFFLFIFIRQQKLALSDTILNEYQSQKKIMGLIFEQTDQRYKSRIKSMVKNRQEIVRSFAAKDRDKLLQLSSIMLGLLQRENPYLRAFFFANSDNTIFLRVHKPQLYGDDLSLISPLTIEGNRVRKMLAGFEIVKGGLQYRIVYPVFVDGEYIGLLGFGIDADFFLDQLHLDNFTHMRKNYQERVDIALVFSKSELSKAIFFDKPYRTISNHAIFAKSPSLFQQLPDSLDLAQEIHQIKLNGANYAVLHAADFKDYKDNLVAWSIALIDIQTLVAGTKRTIVLTIMLALALLFFTFVMLYYNFNLLFKKISTLNDSLKQSNQELEHRVEQRTAELQEGEERLKAIFEANPDPVAVYDVNGYPLYLNPAFTKVFGWALDELQGRHIPFVPDSEKKLTQLKIKEIFESGNPVRFETKRSTKYGKTIDVLLSAAIIKDLQGINNGLVVNLTDMSEQKMIEGQLRQSQKMEAIGTLAGGIAHDFNNILSGILGFTHLAEININDPVIAKKKLNQVVKGAQRAAGLVQQILAYSRQVEYKKNPLELFSVVKEAVNFLRASIPQTVEIQEKISSRSMVLADSTQVHQVVINLCTNAYHAMRDSGGILSVELEDVEITPRMSDSMANSCKPGSYVKLEVRDTGHGMDKKTLERIFDPYFTTKDISKGTGLGLSAVDGIVQKHKGFMKIYSEIGQGSIFQVFWPILGKDVSQHTEE
ncbi:MAG: hypothetical protein DRH34_08520 [Deltaproteobacteria bacterium]|nr:MAG: hypothetical protein DRH34_08520 [Deltaproteobacteria bacterium]